MSGEEHGGDGGERALLAPFYANGTLAAEDKARIEAAMPADPALRDEVEAAQGISALVKAGGAALASDIARRPSRLRTLTAWIAPRGEQRPGAIWKVALAAGLAAAIVQAGFVGWERVRNDRYAALSGPAAPEGTAEVIVRLKSEARWGDVEALLAAEGLEIVGGPHDEALDLALPPGASRDEALRRLKASPLVAFAGPAS